MMIYPAAIPMGNTLFLTWPQLDQLFDRFAKSYFGPHVRGEGERDETDCNISFTGLKVSDYEKFCQLFNRYDKDFDCEPEYEFCTGEQSALCPTCVTLGVLSDILHEEFQFPWVGKLSATYDGVYVMENELDYNRFIKGKSAPREDPRADTKPALDAQISDAAARTSDPNPSPIQPSHTLDTTPEL